MKYIDSFFTTRRFLPLFVTQFTNAFSDNAFKNAIAILITYRIAAGNPQHASLLVTLSSGLFILPYFLFSALAGQLADKYDRGRLARIYKGVELFLMIMGIMAFYHHNSWFLMVILFCMGSQSTFFGPVKYSLLPQQLYPEELMEGNAYVEGATFISILIGTIVGGLLILRPDGILLISIVLTVSALTGLLASSFILPAPGASPLLKVNKNFLLENLSILKGVANNKKLLLYLLLISWFWLVGSIFLAQISLFVKEMFFADETVVTVCLTLFSLGIASGSIICTRLAGGKASFRFVPGGAAGMSLFIILFVVVSRFIPPGEELYSLAQFIKNPAAWPALIIFFGLACCGGIYTVPLYTLMQTESDPKFIARTIAANNIINSFFMVVSVLIVMIMYAAGFKVTHVFLLLGLISIGVAFTTWRIKQRI